MATPALSQCGLHALRRGSFILGPWTCYKNIRMSRAQRDVCWKFSVSQRFLSDGSASAQTQWDAYKQSFHFPPATPADQVLPGVEVTVHGFLGRRRDVSAKATFVDVVRPGQPRPVQIRSTWETEGSPEHTLHMQLKAVLPYSPVCVSGTVEEASDSGNSNALVLLGRIQELNAFPRDIIVSKHANFPATARHLQMRFSTALQRRLSFRSDVAEWSRQQLTGAGFREFETPVLFKSTPEGAREFVVPTRRRGYAYALPQSPQQFKQILMAAGVTGGYFQFARCFRDEDLRADRQPEFTQLDLEMAFASGEDVMQMIERYIRELIAHLEQMYELAPAGDEFIPVPRGMASRGARPFPTLPNTPFLRITYDEAMSKYGSDKPDLRIPGEICRLEHILPSSFTGMITHLENPIVEAWRFRLAGSPEENRAFVQTLFDALPSTLAKNPDGLPAVLFHDASKPLCGLAALGHEAFDELMGGTRPELVPLVDGMEDGDVIFLQARTNAPFDGAGSTALGQLRLEVYRAAVDKGLLGPDVDARSEAFRFLWVVGFPMFTTTAVDDTGSGQGGRAGFSATHHPFTAPLTPADFDLLTTDPLRAKADHYDLVVNGIELGGGSRRIHVARVQEFVMRDILQMDDRRVAQFSHLLEALRAGCPPHAGIALGFDRLVAVLSGTSSVRDVIAFPKSMKGEDLSVRSPGRITPVQLETYHLALRPASGSDGKR